MTQLPTVAITLDDGPSVWTPRFLDVLRDHDARATFFVLGENIPGNEQTLARAVAEGHEIGIHGWSHTRVSELSTGQLRQNILRTQDAIATATGRYATRWRPPWHETTEGATLTAAECGLELTGVTLDALDGIAGELVIVGRVLDDLHEGAIIGLHDGIAPNGNREAKSRTNTLRALPRILDHCRSVTVSELLA